jgi:hypothetical protein
LGFNHGSPWLVWSEAGRTGCGAGGEEDYLCSKFRNNAFFFFLFFMGLLEKFCQHVSENEGIAIIAIMKCSNAKILRQK